MTNYTELVKALRCKCDDCEGCDLAFFDKDEGWMCQYVAKEDDAADAIEKITAMYEKAEMDATNLTGRLAQAETDIERLNLEIDKRIATEIELSNQGDALQAEVAELKRVNMEIFDDLPKRGKWIVKGANRMDCSVCGHSVCFAFGLSDGSFDLYKYCPECGAKMEVQE